MVGGRIDVVRTTRPARQRSTPHNRIPRRVCERLRPHTLSAAAAVFPTYLSGSSLSDDCLINVRSCAVSSSFRVDMMSDISYIV